MMNIPGLPNTDRCSSGKKRVLTPARREQNRVAQKQYRHRQKAEKQHRQALANSSRKRSQPPPLRPLQEKAVVPDGTPCSPRPAHTRNISLGNSIEPSDSGPLQRRSSMDLTPLGESDNAEQLQRSHASNLLLTECLDLSNRPQDLIQSPYHQSHPAYQKVNPAFPDLYANTLRLRSTHTLTACFTNALFLNIDLSNITNLNYISPFFDPCASPSADPTAISDPSIPPHLRPTLPQILFAHHASLDLLPLPELRARAILFSVSMAGTFNLMDLKKDIYYGEGLVCWAGSPWDMRSWEAAPWFLRKWKVVVGGDGGEIWKNSVWWRRLRGEI